MDFRMTKSTFKTVAICWIFAAGMCDSVSVIKQEPKYKEQFAIEGSSYKMKCLGPTGGNISETHYIVWTINGRPPLRGPKYKILTDGLVIRNVSKADTSLNYTCSALDRVAFIPVYSENIKLKLRQREGKALEEPRAFVSRIIGEKVKLWGILSQSKTLPCRMYSRPSPKFEWKNLKTGEKIENNSTLYKIAHDETSSNLTVFIANKTLFGEYSCRASNNLGESTQIFILAEGYRPKFPFMFPTFIGKDRVTLKVEPQEDRKNAEVSKEDQLPVTNYLIQYTTMENLRRAAAVDTRKKWNSISRTVMAGGEAAPLHTKSDGEIFELLGLQENTTYFVRAAVSNAAGISNFSPAVRVTTDVQPSPSQIQRRPVYVKKEDKDKVQPSQKKENREEYGRSNNLNANAPRGPNPDAEEINPETQKSNDCRQPKYKKTVIITTISTTLFENVIDDEEGGTNGKLAKGNDGNSSLVKKRVEEDTKVDRMNVCTIE